MQRIYNVIMLNNYLIIITICKDSDIIYEYFMFNKKIINAKTLSENVVFV